KISTDTSQSVKMPSARFCTTSLGKGLKVLQVAIISLVALPQPAIGAWSLSQDGIPRRQPGRNKRSSSCNALRKRSRPALPTDLLATPARRVPTPPPQPGRYTAERPNVFQLRTSSQST